jgi:hypothetical protein
MSGSVWDVASRATAARARPDPGTAHLGITHSGADMQDDDLDADGRRVLRGWTIGGMLGACFWALIGYGLWSWLS